MSVTQCKATNTRTLEALVVTKGHLWLPRLTKACFGSLKRLLQSADASGCPARACVCGGPQSTRSCSGSGRSSPCGAHAACHNAWIRRCMEVFGRPQHTWCGARTDVATVFREEQQPALPLHCNCSRMQIPSRRRKSCVTGSNAAIQAAWMRPGCGILSCNICTSRRPRSLNVMLASLALLSAAVVTRKAAVQCMHGCLWVSHVQLLSFVCNTTFGTLELRSCEVGLSAACIPSNWLWP